MARILAASSIRPALTALFGAVLFLTMSVTAARACQPVGWGKMLSPGEQKFEVVERVQMPSGRDLVGIRFGELTGSFAKVYLFMEFDGECPTRAVSFGSYEATNAVTDGGRLYHLDLYKAGWHATLGFFDAVISYQEAKSAALKEFKR